MNQILQNLVTATITTTLLTTALLVEFPTLTTFAMMMMVVMAPFAFTPKLTPLLTSIVTLLAPIATLLTSITCICMDS